MLDTLQATRQMARDLASEELYGYAQTAREAAAEIERLRGAAVGSDVGSWRPISTAPKDGTCVLLGFHGHPEKDWCAIAGWFEGGANDRCWYDIYHGEVWPSHWMPLLGAPTVAAAVGSGVGTAASPS